MVPVNALGYAFVEDVAKRVRKIERKREIKTSDMSLQSILDSGQDQEAHGSSDAAAPSGATQDWPGDAGRRSLLFFSFFFPLFSAARGSCSAGDRHGNPYPSAGMWHWRLMPCHLAR